jgi:ferredoxin-type protein NapG
MNRRKFFKQGFSKIFKAVEKTKEITQIIPQVIGEAITEKPKEVNIESESDGFRLEPEYLKPKKARFKNLKYPPGAWKEKGKFESKCTGCGDCIHYCPYDVIFPIYDEKLNKSLPVMDLNQKACLMCIDYPCIQSCNYGALKPFKKKEAPKFGQAKLIFDHCLNHGEEDLQCTTCRDTCPVENVVNIKKLKPSFSTSCTGCGQCVTTCPTFPKAIVIK